MLKRLEVMTVASEGVVSSTDLEPVGETDSSSADAAHRPGHPAKVSGVYVVCCLGGILPTIPPPEKFPPFVEESVPQTDVTLAQPRTLEEQVNEAERRIIDESLRRHNFRRNETARELGISRVTLYNKMKKFGMLYGREAE